MSSDRCEDLLLDIASGALGEEQARAARAEVEGCAEHAPALRRVERGLRFAALMPWNEPSPALDAAILAAARAKAESKPASAVTLALKPSFFGRALAVLRRIATGPQLATSTVMLLVVAIGLWYLPTSSSTTPNADGDTVMSPRLAEEAPAAPAEMAEGPAPARRADSTVPAVAPAEVAGTPPAGGSTKPAPSRTYPRKERHQSTRSARLATRQLRASGAASRARQRVAPPPAAPASEPEAESFAYAPSTGQAAPSAGMGATMDGVAMPAMPRTSRSVASSAGATAPRGAAEATAAGRPATTGYAQAMSLYRSGRYSEAARLFSTVAAEGGPDAASAVHYLARSQARSGQCAIAVRAYERLLQNYPSYGQRTQAMIEAAKCYERTGRLAMAEQWLERAIQSSPSSVNVRTQLERVRAERSAPAATTDRATSTELGQ